MVPLVRIEWHSVYAYRLHLLRNALGTGMVYDGSVLTSGNMIAQVTIMFYM